MISLNPYTYIAAAAVLASIGGGFYYQGAQIHHWHTKFDQAHDDNVVWKAHAKEATQLALSLAGKTGSVVTRVTTEKTPPVVKVIHDAPLPQDCSTPALDELRNNT